MKLFIACLLSIVSLSAFGAPSYELVKFADSKFGVLRKGAEWPENEPCLIDFAYSQFCWKPDSAAAIAWSSHLHVSEEIARDYLKRVEASKFTKVR